MDDGDLRAAAKSMAEEAEGPPAPAERYYVPGASPIEIRPRADGRWQVTEGGSAIAHSASLGEARKAAYGAAVRSLEREVSNARHRVLVCERSLGRLGKDDPFLLGRFMDGEED